MKRVVITVLIAGAILAVFGIGKTSNCGGNSAALFKTRYVATSFNLIFSGERNDEVFRLEDWLSDPESRTALSFGWGVRSFWLKNEIGREDALPVAVCGQVFSNVPQPTIWNLFRKNPGFAASYMDGTARILSIEEFNDFDFTDYTHIHESHFEVE